MSNNFHLQLYRGTTSQNNAYTGLAGEITADTQAGNIRLHDGSKVGGYVVASMPVGSIIPYAGTTIPDGYLLCDGSAISRTTYSALFASIGTTYGEGDGNSTFNIPDLTNRFIEGNGSGYIEAGLPDITGEFSGDIYLATDGGLPAVNGCFVGTRINFMSFSATNTGWLAECLIDFRASESSSIYGNSTTVQPASCKCYFCIKY